MLITSPAGAATAEPRGKVKNAATTEARGKVKYEMFYEGKAKKLYSTADPDLVIAYFKDDATAFNAKKRGTIEDKGVINNRMSELFFGLLERAGVRTQFGRSR